jgi:hypothetical protein
MQSRPAREFSQIWWNLTKKVPFHEVDLFRKLNESITSTTGRTRVEEFHGSKHQVVFAGKGSWTRKIPRCEIADLFIVTFSRHPNLEIRMTFLQAKLSKRQHDLCREHPNHITVTQFLANMEQWDLLSRRPPVIGVPPFEPPNNLLSGALLQSVGSFCVFYKNKDGAISFFFASADALKPLGNPTTRSADLVSIPGPQDRSINGYNEKRIACCPSIFGEALFGNLIGTPISFNNILNENDEIYRRNARQWLGRTLRTNLTQGEFPITRQLLSVLEIPEREDFDRSAYPLPTRTMIIDTDMEI